MTRVAEEGNRRKGGMSGAEINQSVIGERKVAPPELEAGRSVSRHHWSLSCEGRAISFV